VKATVVVISTRRFSVEVRTILYTDGLIHVPERNTLDGYTCTIDFSSHKKLVAACRCRARGLKGCGNEGGGGRDSAGELLAIDLTIYWRLQFQGRHDCHHSRETHAGDATPGFVRHCCTPFF
jgi:hypothetical protein